MVTGEPHLRAAADAQSLVDGAEGGLQGAAAVLQRIRDFAVAAGTPSNDSARQALALEVGQLREQLIGITDTRHRGRALFAGFSTDDPVAPNGAWDSATPPTTMAGHAAPRGARHG